jgi:hypothetical protein
VNSKHRRILRFAFALVGSLFFLGPVTAQTWSQLSTAGSPPTSGPGGGGYDVANNRLIVFFPFETGGQVWVLTNANGLSGAATWTQLMPTGSAPTAGSEASVVYDHTSNQLIVYGGCLSGCGAPLTDVAVLSNANGLGGPPAWSQSSTNPAEPRDHHSAVYNSLTNRMIAFGGGLAFFGTDENDTRVLSPANASNPTWTTLSAAGALPGVREGNSAVYNQANNVMTIFGGSDDVLTCCPYEINDYNDVWALSDADGTGTGIPTWTQLHPTGKIPPARQAHSAVYDSKNNRMYIFGGFQWSNALQNFTPLGDLWKLSNADDRGTTVPRWTQIGQLGTPPGATYGHFAVFDSVHQRMIVFGGAADRSEQFHSLTFILDLLED